MLKYQVMGGSPIDPIIKLRDYVVSTQQDMERNAYRAPPGSELARAKMQGKWETLEELRLKFEEILKPAITEDDKQ